MSFAGKLARGLLSGAAGYYGKQAETQEYDRRADALVLRETAMKNIDAQIAEQRAERDAQRTRDTNTLRVQDETDAAITMLPKKTQAQKELIEAKEQAAYKRWKLQFPVEQRGRMTIEQYRQAQETARNTADNAAAAERASADRAAADARAAADRNEHVVATGVDGAGNTVVAKGNDSHVTFRGMKPVPRADPMADLGLGGTPAPPPARSAAPAPAQPAADDKTYTMADLQFTATQNGISVAEARQRLNARGYRLTN